MPLRTADELASLLGQLRLVEPDVLLRAMQELSPASKAEALLSALERQHLLTNLQVERIRKGETDGLVLGGYKLLYRNASGSFARVYRASSLADGSMIGLKVLRERWANDADMVRLFHREGDLGQKLKHPNIVPVYGTAVQGPHHFITMEFVEGGNLRDFVKIRGRLSPTEAAKYTIDMAQGLEHALKLGITHRDLKMTNVLMSSQGVAKLIDFGLAADEQLLNRIGSSDLQQAVEYSTLERGTGAPANDPRSDLFFLGVILYELLTGVPPYARTRDKEERKRFSRYRDVRPVTTLEPTLPHRVAATVDRLLRITPSERFQSPGEVAAEMRQALSDMGEAPPPGAENGAQQRTVLCVEDRPQQQEMLRQYLSKHGYRVLLLENVERALSRVRQQAPDCVLLMGDSIGDRVAEDFGKVLSLGRSSFLSAVLVLGEEQTALQGAIANDNPLGKVLVQPVKLRDLRNAIDGGLSVRARYRGRS